MYNQITTANTSVGKLLREQTITVVITRKKLFSFILFSFILFLLFILHEKKKDVSCTYCGNHFTTHVSQTIVLDPLNLYSGPYQLFLNKIGKIF